MGADLTDKVCLPRPAVSSSLVDSYCLNYTR